MRLIHSRLCGAWLFAAVAFASPARAQHPRLSAREVGQIADEALRVIVPPDSSLTGMSVAARGIALDARGTLAGFGATSAADTTLPLTRPVLVATDSLLRDCYQTGQGSCAGLGSRVFVRISPLSLTSSHAHVRVTVEWATPMVHANADGTMTKHTYLSWFSATIHLARTAGGGWIFVKQDPTVVVG